MFTDVQKYNSCPNFFRNIKSHFKENFDFGNSPFKEYYAVGRKFLLENAPRPDVNIRFIKGRWIYPQSVEEMKLFGDLFVNKAFVNEVSRKYSDFFKGVQNTIGLTIRRGDFIGKKDFFYLSDDELLKFFNDLKSTYFYSTRFIVDSDDLPFVRKFIADHGINMDNKIVFLDGIPIEEGIVVLSLCNSVICNGRFCIGDYQRGQWESTYG